MLRHKLGVLRKAEHRAECEEDLHTFLKAAWPYVDSSEFQDCWAIQALCDHLEAVTLGSIDRLLINFPPRCSKTTIASIVYPAWTWARRVENFRSGAGVRFLCASYGHSLSLDSANKSRRLMGGQLYQEYWGNKFKLSDDQNMKSNFANSAGGARLATSIGGSLIGLGGDVLIADDLNNTEVVESDAERSTVSNFWNEFHSTRLNDPKQSAIIVIQQRLHKGDVSGLILDSGENWVHLCLPMRYETNRRYVTVKLPQYDADEPWDDPRTDEGELMWPERFGEAEVKNLEKILGPYLAAGRLQQRPRPRGGSIILSEWWQPWDDEEARRYGLEWAEKRKEYPLMDIIVGSLDTSYGEKKENSYNALTIWGIWTDRAKNKRAMLMYAWAKHLQLHGKVPASEVGEKPDDYTARKRESWGLVQWVADSCRRYKTERLLIEDKTRGRDVANELSRLYARESWGVQMVNPSGDKVARAHAVVPLFSDGAVWAPVTAWSEEVIQQAEDFPKGDHDDLVDSVTQFLKWARENNLLVMAEESSQMLADDMEFTGRRRGAGVANSYGL